jgi:hypothetical protein
MGSSVKYMIHLNFLYLTQISSSIGFFLIICNLVYYETGAYLRMVMQITNRLF